MPGMAFGDRQYGATTADKYGKMVKESLPSTDFINVGNARYGLASTITGGLDPNGYPTGVKSFDQRQALNQML